MLKQSFPYKKEKSNISSTTKRPLIDLHIHSEVRNKWMLISNILADTGADISILPRTIGELLIKDFIKGKYLEIRGISPGAYVEVFINMLKCRINNLEFKIPFAIADSDDVPPILGRHKGLDIFEVTFYKGIETQFLKN